MNWSGTDFGCERMGRMFGLLTIRIPFLAEIVFGEGNTCDASGVGGGITQWMEGIGHFSGGSCL